MKHILNTVKCLSLLVVLLMWSSCTDEMEKGSGKVVEGIPTTVRFSVNLPEVEVITTKSSSWGEGYDRIDNLYLIAFKENGEYETCEKVEILNGTEVLFHVESGEKYIYAIANTSSGVYKDITAWITDEVMGKRMNRDTFLKQVVNLKTKSVSNLSGGGVMVGGFCLNGNAPTKETEVLAIEPCPINPGKDGVVVNKGAIYLQRMRSEIIFNITGNTSFSLTGYEIHNVPMQSTLFHSKDVQPLENEDDYFTIKENYVKPTNLAEGEVKTKFSFYMLENTFEPKDKITDTAAREKSGNYPTYSTYVVLKGTYKGFSKQPEGDPVEVEASVTYYIHLGKGAGENPADYSDFSTYRNKQYIYNITVTGVNSIIAEVEVKDMSDDPRAEGDVIIKDAGQILYCDAHYETRVISFNKREIPTEGLYCAAKTPFGGDTDWVQFWRNDSGQKTATDYTIAKNGSVDGSKKLMTVDEFLEDLKDWNDGEETRYYTCFVNEFFYEGEGKELRDFVNVEDRTLLIGAKGKFQDPDIGNSSVLRGKYTFKQRSIKSVFNLEIGGINPWGIETWNETGMLVFGVNDTGGTLDGNSGKEPNNGYKNQIKFLNNIEKDWAQAIDYSFIDESINEPINEPINKSPFPTYNLQPNKETSSKAFTGAMFACMQRNRDENGNGVIDDDEVKWYLPASNQYITLWMGADALQDATLFNNRKRLKENHYFTSTYGSNIYWSEEGITADNNVPTTPTTISKKSDLFGTGESGNDRQYRCVRNLRGNENVSQIFTKVEDPSSKLLQVKPTNLVKESLRKEILTKEIDSADGHLLDTDDSNRPYEFGFEFYTNVIVDVFYDRNNNIVKNVTKSWKSFYKNANDNPDASYCAQYMRNNGYGDGWRMPSQRELALMSMSSTERGGFAVSRTLHLLTPPDFNSKGATIDDGSEYSNKTHTYAWFKGHHSLWTVNEESSLRCVRDLGQSN